MALVLLADDDAELLPVLALHLRNDEHDVICATGGTEALETARQRRPDVMLVDISMTADDIKMYTRLTDDPDLLAIPVIYLVSRREARRRGTPRLPAQSMLRKPIAVSELLAKVEGAVRARENEGGAEAA